MKNFILEYCKIISYTLMGLIFAYSAFYLLINVYHEKELNRSFSYNAQEDVTYHSVLEKLELVRNNVSGFNSGNYKGSISIHHWFSIQGRIQNCAKVLENEAFLSFQDKKEITLRDVGLLRDVVQNEVLNGCLVEQLYDIAVSNQTDRYPIASLKRIAPYMELNIKSLLGSINYISSDLLNNNIYYFTTEHTNTNLLNKAKLGYSELLAIYNRSADLLVQLSEWFNEEV